MDSAGNLYGTTFQGGIGQGQLGSGAGVVFKIDWSGRYSVLYRFTGGADGSGPASNLILDAAGYLYGTTAGGGPQNYGVVFKVSQSGQETVLYGFTDGSEGVYPSGVTADAAGNLYGTTLEGGEYGTGAVFKLSRSGQVTVLHTFGQYGRPSGVILDAAGNLYGGAQDLIYKLDPAGNLTALAEFDGVPSELVRDTSGNLYFTSGAPGSVYKLETNGNLTLYSFTGIALTGIIGPNATPVVDTAGNLYGTSSNDGSAGIVYEIEAGGTFKMLDNFQPAIGGTGPYSGVTLDAAGNLFGTTNRGGIPLNLGVVYKLSPDGQETVLHAFQGGGTDGANPVGNVVLDRAGNLYGVATNAGADNHGMVYKLTPSGGETILHSFAGGSDGTYPFGLALDSAGNLYGAASGGGANGEGVIYKRHRAWRPFCIPSLAAPTDTIPTVWPWTRRATSMGPLTTAGC